MVDTKYEQFLFQYLEKLPIDELSEKIQPKGHQQERTLNILQFCPDGEIAVRIAQIYAQLDPFSQEKQWFVAS